MSHLGFYVKKKMYIFLLESMACNGVLSLNLAHGLKKPSQIKCLFFILHELGLVNIVIKNIRSINNDTET